jgi:predicted AAA+ superfamily ATPase
MHDSYIFQKYKLLPDVVQKQISDYIEFLVSKYQKNQESEHHHQEKKKSNFGSAKGLIIISDDFDEPIDEFKPYM